MFVAQEFDAEIDGRPYLSPNRRRLVEPDLRSRLYGYLAHAPQPAPGWRTDGVWVWPESLASHVLTRSAVPQRQFAEHIGQRWILLPDQLDDETMDRARAAVTQPPTPDPPAEIDWTYYTSTTAGGSASLTRQGLGEHGQVLESTFFPEVGWDRSNFLFRASAPDAPARTYHEISALEAADLVDRLANASCHSLLDRLRESAPATGLHLARTFDRELHFSPVRLRIPESARRQRLARYLMGGRLVLRATGGFADPLDPGGEAMVPMSFRTDGEWVWQEAVAYYVLRRGIAPQLDLLCHIEERAMTLPEIISDSAVAGAWELIDAAPAALEPPSLTYHDYESWTGAHLLLRSWVDVRFREDELGRDLRWSSGDSLYRHQYQGADGQVSELSEAEAAAILDRRLDAGGISPPAL